MASAKYSSLKKRLLDKVLQLGPALCWPYRGYKDTTGEGKIWFKVGTPPISIERAVYLIYHGDIPEGVRVLSCPILKDCCNPAHIELGTSSDFGDKILRTKRQQRKAVSQPKLTEFEIIAIYLSDSPTSELANKYQVSAAYISNIRAGRRHQKVTSRVS